MSTKEHTRFAVFSQKMHPYQHVLSEFYYSNPRIPLAISNPEEALNYLIAVMYPRYIGTFATPGALPGVATANDYAFVTDDGDGKSAGYVYSSIDGVTQWIKRYDVDWSVDGIFAEFQDRTQFLYAWKYGFDDIDATGAVIAGLYAGQKIYGGKSTNTNLTFNANSADATGFVQTDNIFRPTTDNSLTLGTATERWSTIHGLTAVLGTMTLASGSITDSSGAISFDNENLTTTGAINSGTLDISGQSDLAGFTLSDIAGPQGQIVHTSGVITFDNENLITTGTLASGTITVSSDLVLATGSITSVSGAISFGDEDLSTTGTLNTGDATITRLDADNLRLDGNTLSVLNANGNLILVANGTGVVDIQSAMTTLGQTVTGTLGITGQLNIDNLRLDGNVISSTNLDGNITLTPNGTGAVESSARILPAADGTLDLGAAVSRFRRLYLSDFVGDGTNSTSIGTILSLRSAMFRDLAQTIPAVAGDALFWDSVNSVWLANHPDTEITHNELTGLTTGDAGHTQFAMLAGRAGGQVLQGGTAASETLTLESTAHATKGHIIFLDILRPGSDNLVDIGTTSFNVRDLYIKGQGKGFRLENFTSGTLPASSASAIGRILYATDNRKVYVDTGSVILPVSASRHIEDTVWNGSDTSKVVTVSANIADARNAIWQLKDNTNNYEVMFVKIEASATQVTITVAPALPAGSYKLVGIE